MPGAGKTTLATILARRLNAVHFNADSVRAEINKGLGFSHEDRIEQARRMGWLWDQVVKANTYAIAEFICPTPQTRAAFRRDRADFRNRPAQASWVWIVLVLGSLGLR